MTGLRAQSRQRAQCPLSGRNRTVRLWADSGKSGHSNVGKTRCLLPLTQPPLDNSCGLPESCRSFMPVLASAMGRLRPVGFRTCNQRKRNCPMSFACLRMGRLWPTYDQAFEKETCRVVVAMAARQICSVQYALFRRLLCRRASPLVCDICNATGSSRCGGHRLCDRVHALRLPAGVGSI